MNKKIHFIGIGGIGMSGLAQLCIQKGCMVSGSDLRDSSNLERLRQQGASIFIGHKKENIKKVLDFVVYSSAIHPDNEEAAEARNLGVPLIRRAEFLALLMQEHTVIAVTGAHGKTTTSSLLSHVLIEAKVSPTVAVGGVVRNFSDNSRLGDSSFFVAEADESDGTFLLYRPKYSIVTNIDCEHLDFYSSFENIQKAFSDFIGNTNEDGCVFWCYDDSRLADIIRNSDRRNISFGLDKCADIYALNIDLKGLSSAFDVYYRDKLIGRFDLPLSGRHNISNALSVIALTIEMGIDMEQTKKYIRSFLGVERRFQVKYRNNGVLIIDDYAHHPTEIKAAINAAKSCLPQRLLVIFQPHRYSRVKHLLDEFSESFLQADLLFITEIYAAGENNIHNIESRHILEQIKKGDSPEVELIEKNRVKKHLLDSVCRGDLVLFLGAGDINNVSDEFVRELQGKD